METEEHEKAYTEIACLLAVLPREYTKQIPLIAKQAIKSKINEKYFVKFDSIKSVNDYKFSPIAKNLLAVLKYNCWADEDGKKKMMALLKKNTKIEYIKDW